MLTLSYFTVNNLGSVWPFFNYHLVKPMTSDMEDTPPISREWVCISNKYRSFIDQASDIQFKKSV